MLLRREFKKNLQNANMPNMKKILLSSFACIPNEGSEQGNGWNWAIGLAKEGYEVHCITRSVGKPIIETFDLPKNLTFHFVSLPLGMEKFFLFSHPTMYLYYIMWQWLAYKKGKSLHRIHKFSLCHHVTWGSLQLGSFMYKISIPFIFGPVGGGQKSSVAFKKYFGSAWAEEEKREKISKLMFKFNPACKTMLKKAKSILVSNPDTANAVKAQGLNNYIPALDAALPLDFFPENFKTKELQQNTLKLLWVGRFLPRKGILLILEVMEKLKPFPGIKLTVVGDGQQRDRFLETIKEKELDKNVIWKGNIPFNDVKAMYQNHDVFFFTSLRDSGPTQLVEAMAYGMPVVTINIHGQAFIVNDKTGFRCNCDTPEQAIEELYNSILKLYNNQELVTSMSREANNFALKQTWENKIKTVIEQSYPV